MISLSSQRDHSSTDCCCSRYHSPDCPLRHERCRAGCNLRLNTRHSRSRCCALLSTRIAVRTTVPALASWTAEPGTWARSTLGGTIRRHSGARRRNDSHTICGNDRGRRRDDTGSSCLAVAANSAAAGWVVGAANVEASGAHVALRRCGCDSCSCLAGRSNRC